MSAYEQLDSRPVRQPLAKSTSVPDYAYVGRATQRPMQAAGFLALRTHFDVAEES
jgi:hypothetical protein